MANISYFTKEKYDELQQELLYLKTKGRAEIAEEISEARDKGDLRENAEYDAAKDAQGMLEMKISKLETTISNARILDESQIDTSKVSILSKVKIRNTANKKLVLQYTIVAEEESDLKQNKISVLSPIGKGLLGKKVGEMAEVEAPRGKMKFEILEITR
ncbi:MAG: transcription elongation factor GreA [Flexibacter sp. CG_4_10_14_3_um_filter_32_15]|nr:MAG: transcription elongation factor GreA [Flexibacter sp. CG_4_10_14_3_um_filter_32_15]